MKLICIRDISEIKIKEILKNMNFDYSNILRTLQESKYIGFLLVDVSKKNLNILKNKMWELSGIIITQERQTKDEKSKMPVIIIGSDECINKLCEGVNGISEELSELSSEIERRMKRYNETKRWKIRDRTILIDRPLIMGILNVTPDSFYNGGRYFEKKKAVEHIEEMLDEGADIIDIGGMSSRPGSKPISEKEELKRVLPIVREANKLGAIISVDTYRSNVAKRVIDEGTHIINDISALRWDDNLTDVILSTDVGLVIMHSYSKPLDMQKSPSYKDVVTKIYNFIEERISFAVNSKIPRESIVIDFGIGFGKQLCDNLTLIHHIDKFKGLKRPILVGASRKSFIEHALGLEKDKRLIPSIAVAIYSFMKGADIIRVHDVRETKEALEMVKCIEQEDSYKLLNNLNKRVKNEEKVK
ncbi:MAG: dihydropteroate synthase [bacterium]